mgnify:FL=1
MIAFDFPEVCRRSPADESLGDALNGLISTVEDLQQEVTTLKNKLQEVSDGEDMSTLSG